jgi:hypothetical protein
MSRIRLAGSVLVGATLLLIATLPPESRLPIARVLVFAVGLVAAIRVIGRITPPMRPAPDLFELDASPPITPTEVAGIRRIELDLQMTSVHPFGIQWTRPLLRELATGRLWIGRGIDIEHDPVAARAALGESLWHMIEPDVGQWRPDDMRISLADLEAAVTRLEQV